MMTTKHTSDDRDVNKDVVDYSKDKTVTSWLNDKFDSVYMQKMLELKLPDRKLLPIECESVIYHTSNIMSPELYENPIWEAASKNVSGNMVLDILKLPHRNRSEEQLSVVRRWLTDCWHKTRNMSKQRLNNMIKVLKLRTYDIGSLICVEGEVGHEFYIVVTGDVAVCKGGTDLINVGTLHAGMSFGELALLTNNGTRAASIKCLNIVVVAVIERGEFQEFTQQMLLLEHRENFEILKDLPIFKNWTKLRLSLLCRHLVRMEYQKGELIFRQGDPSQQFCVVLEGSVNLIKEVYVTSKNKWPVSSTEWDTKAMYTRKPIVGMTKSKMEYFGEYHLLHAIPYSYSAEAAIDGTILMTIQRTELIDQIAGAGFSIDQVLADADSSDQVNVDDSKSMESLHPNQGQNIFSEGVLSDERILKNLPTVSGGPSSVAVSGTKFIYPNPSKVRKPLHLRGKTRMNSNNLSVIQSESISLDLQKGIFGMVKAAVKKEQKRKKKKNVNAPKKQGSASEDCAEVKIEISSEDLEHEDDIKVQWSPITLDPAILMLARELGTNNEMVPFSPFQRMVLPTSNNPNTSDRPTTAMNKDQSQEFLSSLKFTDKARHHPLTKLLRKSKVAEKLTGMMKYNAGSGVDYKHHPPLNTPLSEHVRSFGTGLFVSKSTNVIISTAKTAKTATDITTAITPATNTATVATPATNAAADTTTATTATTAMTTATSAADTTTNTDAASDDDSDDEDQNHLSNHQNNRDYNDNIININNNVQNNTSFSNRDNSFSNNSKDNITRSTIDCGDQGHALDGEYTEDIPEVIVNGVPGGVNTRSNRYDNHGYALDDDDDVFNDSDSSDSSVYGDTEALQRGVDRAPAGVNKTRGQQHKDPLDKVQSRRRVFSASLPTSLHLHAALSPIKSNVTARQGGVGEGGVESNCKVEFTSVESSLTPLMARSAPLRKLSSTSMLSVQYEQQQHDQQQHQQRQEQQQQPKQNQTIIRPHTADNTTKMNSRSRCSSTKSRGISAVPGGARSTLSYKNDNDNDNNNNNIKNNNNNNNGNNSCKSYSSNNNNINNNNGRRDTSSFNGNSNYNNNSNNNNTKKVRPYSAYSLQSGDDTKKQLQYVPAQIMHRHTTVPSLANTYGTNTPLALHRLASISKIARAATATAATTTTTTAADTTDTTTAVRLICQDPKVQTGFRHIYSTSPVGDVNSCKTKRHLI